MSRRDRRPLRCERVAAGGLSLHRCDDTRGGVAPWTEAGHASASEFARRAGERFGEQIERIVLFGSVARGADSPDSDVDVLVVARSRDKRLRDGLDEIAFDLTLARQRGPVFLLYPFDEYARARRNGSELIASIEREGIILWTRNEERSSEHA